jgi:hypothetical protein
LSKKGAAHSLFWPLDYILTDISGVQAIRVPEVHIPQLDACEQKRALDVTFALNRDNLGAVEPVDLGRLGCPLSGLLLQLGMVLLDHLADRSRRGDAQGLARSVWCWGWLGWSVQFVQRVDIGTPSTGGGGRTGWRPLSPAASARGIHRRPSKYSNFLSDRLPSATPWAVR